MKVRIAIIGAGTFGEVHLQTFSQMQRDGLCELVGLADLNEVLLRKRASEYPVPTYTDYQEMIAKTQPDGVTIVTPDHTHRPIVIDSLKAGCHVLVEKPMDVSVEGCHAMIQVAQERSKLLQVDFHKRFDPYHIALKEAVEQGTIGEPLYGYACMEDRIEVPRDWWPQWVSQSSPAWFLGSHFIDLFRWVIGGRKGLRVYASGVKKKLPSMGIDAFDCIQAKIDFEGDISLNLDTSWILPEGFEAIVNQEIRIVGTEGVIEIDSQNRGAEACLRGETQKTLNLGFKLLTKDKWGNTRYEGYGFRSIADFAENIRFLKQGGTLQALKGTYPDGEDGLETTKILCAIHESVKERRSVAIRPE